VFIQDINSYLSHFDYFHRNRSGTKTDSAFIRRRTVFYCY
jgi:hypothetical protein